MAHVCVYLAALAARAARAVVTVCEGRERTAGELLRRVAALSAVLAGCGVRPGDRVALLIHNSDHFLEALLAVLDLGAIAAPLSWRWSVTEASAAAASIAPVALLSDRQLATSHGDCGLAAHCCLQLGGQAPEPGFADAEAAVVRELQATDCRRELACRHGPSGAAVLCFTSGTTGAPKGAVLSHGALHAQAMAKLAAVGYCRQDVYMHCAPLFHVGGLSAAVAILAAGGCQVFLRAFQARAARRIILARAITAFIAVPAMIEDLVAASPDSATPETTLQPPPTTHQRVAHADASAARRASHMAAGHGPGSKSSQAEAAEAQRSGVSLPSVLRIHLGAAELAPALQWRLRLLCPNALLISSYGMTEAGSSITFLTLNSRLVSALAPLGGVYVGRPPPGAQVAIRRLVPPGQADQPVDTMSSAAAACPEAADSVFLQTPRLCGPVEAGEVLVRGPGVMLGYWLGNGPTLPQPLGMWLATGDLGYVDISGGVFLLGRLRDVVRSGGESVPAAEVERCLAGHPGVALVAVVGLPDGRLGERVAAAVQLRTGMRWRGAPLWERGTALPSQPAQARASPAGEGAAGGPQSARVQSGGQDAARGGAQEEGHVVTAATLLAFCREAGLSPYKVPRTVLHWQGPWPANAMGKVDKAAIRRGMRAAQGATQPRSML